MIVVRISGGLGNQMFQHAAGLALAQRHGVALRFDLEWFDRTQLHQGLELPRVFGLDVLRASESEMRQVLRWCSHSLARRIMARPVFRSLRPTSWVIEPHFHYWPGFEAIGPFAYLEGYWQSARYFAAIEPEVRARFRFALPLDARSAALAEQMAACNSVSLHVRCGDFSRDPTVRRVHGVDLSAYYPAAVTEITRRVASPRFFVFSDEPEWVAKNLALPGPITLVDHNRGPDSYRDMQLMAACRHHLIANSSFSWWGAWLNPSPEKIVIAPRQWFRVTSFDTKDIYCPGWIIL
ncbi:MAG: alpha-1,2-fucosyltransferase [Betaproteobacteria bacterium HGW-Betaproteobacteria-11]|nr:MAG: alpha-1,2-fucosyltransferase [Betaproteobacteria bacterium HGW-Betaproteobacteria-11]